MSFTIAFLMIFGVVQIFRIDALKQQLKKSEARELRFRHHIRLLQNAIENERKQ